MRNKRSIQSEKGFVLIATYLILALVSTFALASFARSNAFLQGSERTQNRLVAFNMAEAGVDFALAQLANPATPNWAGTNGFVSLTTNSVRGGFSVTVTTPNNNPDLRIINVTGFSPDNSTASRGYQAAGITAYGQKQPASVFNFGVFGKSSITLTGNASTDSYDSRKGAYGGTNKTSDGDVATNGTAAGAVTLTGNATVKGDVTIGQNGNTATAIKLSGNATISGTKSTAASPFVLNPVTTSMSSSGPLSISGNTTRYMGAGTYRFDSIDITGNATLNITGPVKIYVDGSVKISGNGLATQNNLPTNCLIYVTGSSDVKISGNGDIYAGIYAPNSDVQNTGNGSIFGAVVAENYDQTGNGDIHYDLALKEVATSDQNKIKVKAWQEQNSLSWGTGS